MERAQANAAKEKLVITTALTCFLSPRRGHAGGRFWFWGWPSGQSRREIFKEPANDAPSPWGEGRDEGGLHAPERASHAMGCAQPRDTPPSQRRKSEMKMAQANASQQLFGMDDNEER